MKSRVTVNLLNTSFTLSSDQDSQYFNKIIESYSKLVYKVQKDLKLNDSLKIAIIAGILAMDRNSEVPISIKADEFQIDEKITRMLTKLNQSIIDNK